MKKIIAISMLLGTIAPLTACGYSGVAATGDKVVITRNDGFLFGALRKVFVCKVADSGVSACAEGESP